MDQHTGEDAARLVWLRMRQLTAAPDVVSAEHDFMHDVGLSAGPVRALRGLIDGGPQSMSVLADRLGCDKSYVTSLVKPLVAGGLAVLESDSSDGRLKVVTLTAHGLEVATRARAVHAEPPAAIRNLAPSALAQLARLLP
jgi:DNA-binding MarR family transcriptional regulator